MATISTPDADWFGSETITFTAEDLGTLTASDAATFTLTSVNDAPVVTDIPDQTDVEGASFARCMLVIKTLMPISAGLIPAILT